MIFIMTRPLFLIVLCAVAYAVATFAMKTASHSPAFPILVIIAMCLGSAVVAEVLLLRQYQLGLAYIAILGAESLLVIVAAYLIGEGLDPRQMVGAGLVVAGAALVST